MMKLTVNATSGSLTITGIDSLNGSYITAQYDNFYEGGSGDKFIIAADSFNVTGGARAGLVSNGSVTLKVWHMTSFTASEIIFGNFNHTGEEYLNFYVFTSGGTVFTAGGMFDPFSFLYNESAFDVPVTFTNGTATFNYVPE